MPTEQLNYWFPLLTDNSPFLFAVLDPDHNYLVVNNRYCEVSGLEREELVGRNDKDILGQAFYDSLSLITSEHSMVSLSKAKWC